MRTTAKRAKLREILEREIGGVKSETIRRIGHPDYPVVYEKEVSGDSNSYQVEVELLEKNEQYVRISISMDDGGINACFHPHLA